MMAPPDIRGSCTEILLHKTNEVRQRREMKLICHFTNGNGGIAQFVGDVKAYHHVYPAVWGDTGVFANHLRQMPGRYVQLVGIIGHLAILTVTFR